MAKTKTDTIFTVQEIASPDLDYITINNVNLDPRPFVTISSERYTISDLTIGGILNLSLNGVVYGTGFDQTSKKIRDLLIAVGHHGGCFSGINLSCGNHKIISSGIGYVKNISFNEGDQKNWMNIAPYSIDMVIYRDASGLFFKPHSRIADRYGISDQNTSGIIVKNLSESISIDMQEASIQKYNPTGSALNIGQNLDYWSNEHISIKFDFQIETVKMCDNLDSSGVINIINNRLGKLTQLDKAISGLNTIPNNYSPSGYLNFRNVKIDDTASSISVNGEYIIRPSGEDKYRDVLVTLDTTAESNLDNGERTITINGNIKALAKNTFSDLLNLGGSTNFSSAEDALGEIVSSHASGIVTYLHNNKSLIQFNANSGDFSNRFLASGDGGGPIATYENYLAEDSGDKYRLISKSFKRNYADNSISFTLNYSSKNRCKIPDALWAEVSVDHELPSRRLVEHVVPGRGYPVTQDILCDTLDSFTITINAQYEPTNNIHRIISNGRPDILELIRSTAESLKCNNWMKVSDNETISDNGSFRRVAKFTRPSCFNANALPYK